MLRAYCPMLDIKEFRCHEAKIEESKKPAVAGSQTPLACKSVYSRNYILTAATSAMQQQWYSYTRAHMGIGLSE